MPRWNGRCRAGGLYIWEAKIGCILVGIDNVGMIKRVRLTHQRPILWYYKAAYAISRWISWCWCSMSSYFIEGWPRGWKIAHSDISQDTSLWSVVMPVLSIPVDRAWVIVYSTAVSSLYSLLWCRSKSRSGTGFHHGDGLVVCSEKW